MNRHSNESSSLTRPPRPAGAPRTGKQARSAAKRLVLPGPPPSIRGSRNPKMFPKKTHTKPTKQIPLELRAKTPFVDVRRPIEDYARCRVVDCECCRRLVRFAVAVIDANSDREAAVIINAQALQLGPVKRWSRFGRIPKNPIVVDVPGVGQRIAVWVGRAGRVELNLAAFVDVLRIA